MAAQKTTNFFDSINLNWAQFFFFAVAAAICNAFNYFNKKKFQQFILTKYKMPKSSNSFSFFLIKHEFWFCFPLFFCAPFFHIWKNFRTLNNNNITSLPRETFSGMPRIRALRLSDNPFTCDCHLSWLLRYLRNSPRLAPYTKCHSPSQLKGQSVADLKEQDFKCSGLYTIFFLLKTFHHRPKIDAAVWLESALEYDNNNWIFPLSEYRINGECTNGMRWIE